MREKQPMKEEGINSTKAKKSLHLYGKPRNQSQKLKTIKESTDEISFTIKTIIQYIW